MGVNMKIALSGPQGVGKTTILNKMKNDSWFQKMNLEYIQEIVRNIVKKYNIKINDVGNDDSQLLIANTHYFNFFKNNFVTDRCILDNFIYAELLYKKNKIHK
jgi:GTPase SAR1 family protein